VKDRAEVCRRLRAECELYAPLVAKLSDPRITGHYKATGKYVERFTAAVMDEILSGCTDKRALAALARRIDQDAKLRDHLLLGKNKRPAPIST
jgi:hypothetical protein